MSSSLAPEFPPDVLTPDMIPDGLMDAAVKRAMLSFGFSHVGENPDNRHQQLYIRQHNHLGQPDVRHVRIALPDKPNLDDFLFAAIDAGWNAGRDHVAAPFHALVKATRAQAHFPIPAAAAP